MPRILAAVCLSLCLTGLQATGFGQTVGRVVRVGSGVPVVGNPVVPSRAVSPAVSLSLTLSPFSGASLPSAPAVSLEQAAAESLEVPGLTGEVVPFQAEAPGALHAKTQTAASPQDGQETARPEEKEARGVAVQELSAAGELGTGLERTSTNEAAKTLAGTQFGELDSRQGAVPDDLGNGVAGRDGELDSRLGVGPGGAVLAIAGREIPVRGSLLGRLRPSRWRGAEAKPAKEPARPAASQETRAEPPSTWTNLRNLARGAFYGMVLLVTPIASSFALDPLDKALGLQAFPLLKYLTEAVPAFGVPFAFFWSAFGLFVPLLGYLAVKKGLKSLSPTMPRLPLFLAAGALLATAFYGVILHSVPALILLSLLSTTVLATGEEVMFRAGVLPWLKRRFEARGWRWAVPLAVLLSSAMFSLMHLPVHSFTMDLFVLKLVLGVVLSLLYLKTGNLAAPAAAHSAYNILVSVFTPFIAALAGLPLAGVVAAAVLGVALLVLRSGWLPHRTKGPSAA
ncbi:MAG: CPBP family intramembrane metalloprotease [Elusimicrobia bacterium]|nr:CPBP family intramembrane metalloprotease [Elusimicrobiota bacterium]